MKKGDWVETPRFCKVQIEKVFRDTKTAYKYGFREPTHYESSDYAVLGKSTGLNTMIFAAARKPRS